MDLPDRSLTGRTRRRVIALLATIAVVGAALGPVVAAVDASSLPTCRVADKLTKYHERSDWARSLLDTTYRLPKTYRPVGLTAVSRAGLSGGGSIRKVAFADLKALARASRQAGARLAVESAYRSYATQVWTFASWVNKGGLGSALETSARPGDPQTPARHDDRLQVGRWQRSLVVVRLGAQPGGAWLAKNAWKYGFVMSYPKGKKRVTCYAYEPWHYRYVGRDLAARVHASGKTLRQVLWALQTAPPPTPTPTPEPTPTSEATPTPEPTATPEPTPTDAAPTP